MVRPPGVYIRLAVFLLRCIQFVFMNCLKRIDEIEGMRNN